MSEFFKQLLAQLSAIWRKLNLQQKILTSSLVGLTILGLAGLMIWSGSAVKPDSGYKVLYSNMDLEEAATITEHLQKSNYKYKLENEGRTINVQAKEVYEIRMSLAREGLPKTNGFGYELFDKTNFGMTDYVQKLNARRALEGEIQRTIEGLEEVKAARVHIVVPEPTIFLDQQKDAKASVVIRCKPGRELTKDQVRGISHLVSSSVDGLKPENISIVDFAGKLLSSPFAGDPQAVTGSRNMELQQNVEKYFENKANQILSNVLGPGKAYVKVAVDLDFDQVERNLEKYDPESRVTRSEERIDENVKNAPDGDHQKERSLTNYEIDKKVEHIIAEVGNVKRLTVSVAIDGKYEKGKDGKYVYIARTPEEVQNIEEMVKNTLGYDLTRGDQIAVSSMQFDNEMLRREQDQMLDKEKWDMYMTIAKYVVGLAVVIFFILFLRYLAKTVAEAMNPPVPAFEQFGIEEEVPEEVPEEMKKTSEILERVELLTKEEPVNIASIIRQWLTEPAAPTQRKKKN